MITHPSVAVVVTHYHSPAALLQCLDSLRDHGGPHLAEVVVADSEADPGLGDVLAREHPTVGYLPQALNVGFGALVNDGLVNTTAPYVLVLNADVRLTPGCLDALVAHLDERPGCGVVAPVLRNDDGSLQESTFRFYRPSTVAYRRTPAGATAWGRAELARFRDGRARDAAIADGAPLAVDWALGAALCVRREALAQVGEMDAAYFLYFEDVDWCRRFWISGWRVEYLPTAECHHSHARASHSRGVLDALRNPLTRRHLRSAVRYFAKHGTSGRRPAAAVERTARAHRELDLRQPVGAGAPEGPPAGERVVQLTEEGAARPVTRG